MNELLHFQTYLNIENFSEDQSLSLQAWLEIYKTYIAENDTMTVLSPETVTLFIRKLKNNKAAGPDNIYNEHLKQVCKQLAQPLTALFNLCISLGQLPDSWKHSNMKVLYKGKGDVNSPRSYRGIALSSVIYKLLSSIISDIQSRLTDHFIPREQFGFMPGRSTKKYFLIISFHMYTMETCHHLCMLYLWII
jgi:hypothetical protein